MPQLLLRRCLLIVLFAFAVTSGSSLRAANDTKVYLPLVRASQASLEGSWQGALTQPGKVFAFQLALTQTGTSLQGTATIRDATYFATMSISGAIFGNTVVLDEQRIIESNGVPPGASRWCIKTLTLMPEAYGDQPLVVGSWKQDGCNAGKVYLQRGDGAAEAVSGTWNGTFSQGSTTFLYQLSVNQAQTALEGVGTSRKDTTFGTKRVRGFVVGRYVLLQETELLSSGGASGWCLKTLETTIITGTPRKLEGSWVAVGCVPGSVSVQQ